MKTLRVLIVEDEAVLAMGLEALLLAEGHTVVGWATDQNEAMQMIDRGDFDAAFVDINLADGMTGLDVARAISDRHDVLVVIMTANARKVPEDFAGAVGLIAKPYTTNGVRSALAYLRQCFFEPPPKQSMPLSLALAPRFAVSWSH